jgi:hypothetical protein
VREFVGILFFSLKNFFFFSLLSLSLLSLPRDRDDPDDLILAGPSQPSSQARDADIFDDDAGPVRPGKTPSIRPVVARIAPAPSLRKAKATPTTAPRKGTKKRPRPEAPAKWKEQKVTIDDRHKAVKTNSVYIKSLVTSLIYLDSIENPSDQIRRDIESLRAALVEATKIQVSCILVFQ